MFDLSYTLRTVALGGALLGLVSGVLGSFAVLRRQSLMGDALSHAALPGVTVAFLLSGRNLSALLVGAAVASLIAVGFIRALTSTTRIKQDAAMAIALASWFALGVALLSYIQGRPDAGQAGLDKFIFGQAAAMVQSDVDLIVRAGLIIFAVLGLLWKEFKLITFDPEFAGANGFRVRLLDGILSVLVVAAIVLGLQLAGVILMVGLLIGPPVAARQWTNSLGRMVLLSGIFGAIAGGTGAVVSGLDVNVPTGPLMIVAAFLIVVVSLVLAPGRGMLWLYRQRRRDRIAFARVAANPHMMPVPAKSEQQGSA
jgi:manganese/zinc/iron transport system permease protein